MARQAGATKRTTKQATEKTSAKKVKEEKPVIEESVIEPEIINAAENEPIETPQVQPVLYANAGDRIMTVIHLSFSRTPVYYGNGKKKVFNKFGEKWSISVREFEQEFAPSSVPTALFEQKVITVGEDCPKDIRERMELGYQPNEILSERQARELFSMSDDELCELFDTLCLEHKRLIVKCFADDLENGGLHCDRNRLLKLNDISKNYVEDGQRGMFANILEEITYNEAQNY